VIIGEERAIERAIGNAAPQRTNSRLKLRLRRASTQPSLA
jgi:hypothetical protein